MSASLERSARRRLVIRCSVILIAVGITGVAGTSLLGGCAQPPITVPTRSLERSGRSSFVCLAQPRTEDPQYPGRGEARPITDCTAQRVLEITNYLSDPDAGTDTSAECADAGPSGAIANSSRLPHLYALVTQTTRGEVAVIDMTATNNPVLDEDPSVPGANFLPVGAQPGDIVSTPGGLASFVGVAEVGREGIFALPSSKIRPTNADPCSGNVEIQAPQVSSWPACRLPSAPGQMLLVNDTTLGPDGQPRAACPTPLASTFEPSTEHANGDLGLEGQGRQKLVVTMPDLGGIAVIDAQTLLDQPAGSFGACPVERWLPLDPTVPDVAPPPPFPMIPGHACVSPTPVGPKYARPYESRPNSISYANGRLYAADLTAPLVHVVDLPTPCDPVELLPLLPSAVTDPKRVITTTKVAVASALTPDLKRYLYAVDAEDGSAMVFDVSDDQASRFPLSRPHTEWNPLEPPDRIRFAAPIADLILVERDAPATHPATGVAPHGTRCDPNPALKTCDPHSQSCDPTTLYRTSPTYDSGAGPNKLRGEFAFFALSSGKVAVIDIDDYDAQCRAPTLRSALYGCEPQCKHDSDCMADLCVDGVCMKACTAPSTASDECASKVCGDVTTMDGQAVTACKPTDLVTSQELSCNVVLPNTPRMSAYETYNTAAPIPRVPGIQLFPLLYDVLGTLLDGESPATPRMVATVPVGFSNVDFSLEEGTSIVPLEQSNGTICCADKNGKCAPCPKNVLVMNYEDPRAQLVDQNWTVTFEGALPGFDQQAGNLTLASDGSGALDDADGRFCDSGVLSEKAAHEELVARGVDPTLIDKQAPRLADYVQIADTLADQGDPTWSDPETMKSCAYDSCLAVFGNSDIPQPGRDFKITEAFQDHVELTSRNPAVFTSKDQNGNPLTFPIKEFTKCCFPTLVRFHVRAGGQWVVEGDQSGFLHHVITDPVTGACRNSCDPRLARQNGRAPDPQQAGVGIKDGDLGAFTNPMFRFAVLDGTQDNKPLTPTRDNQFRFASTGSFLPELVDLSAGVANAINTGTSATTTAPLIQPVGITVVPATSELAVTDGTINGLILMSLASPGVSKVFF